MELVIFRLITIELGNSYISIILRWHYNGLIAKPDCCEMLWGSHMSDCLPEMTAVELSNCHFKRKGTRAIEKNIQSVLISEVFIGEFGDYLVYSTLSPLEGPVNIMHSLQSDC